ncbi:hypothetical protein [Muricoccus radiodurans]|uniref:hypothetical protein n=1 Tax=Muricoccus radiodurans TaxID=2231721 RepID=UPI003CEF50F8
MLSLTRFTNLARSPGDPKILATGPSSLASADKLARGLGWFSIGLGLAELFCARGLARFLGIRGHEGLIRAFGARELGAGIMALSVDTRPAILGRIAGDALDIAALAAADDRRNPKQDNVRVALVAVIGVTVLDIVCAQALHARHRRSRGAHRNYADRSGFPGGPEAARGVARRTFETPPDMRAAPQHAP